MLNMGVRIYRPVLVWRGANSPSVTDTPICCPQLADIIPAQIIALHHCKQRWGFTCTR